MTAPLSREQWLEVRRLSVDAVIDKIDRVHALLGYQQRAVGLLDTAGVNVLVIEKSRRIGLTWGLASYAGLTAATSRNAGGMDVLYISYAQEMTREFIDAVAMWLRAFHKVAAEVEEFTFEDRKDGDETRSIQAFRIRLDSGFEVVGLSSAPRSLRGKQGLVIIDEAAFVDSLKELLKAALALRMWGGKIVVCSTHDGVDNEFNTLVQDTLSGRTGYKHMKIDLDDALKDGFYERICLVQGIAYSLEGEAAFREETIKGYGDAADEELFCIPAQGSGTWLPAPLIEARMTEPNDIIHRLELPPDYLHLTDAKRMSLFMPFMAEIEESLEALPADFLYGIGFDFARVADLSILTLLGMDKLLKRAVRLAIEMRAVPYAEQKDVTRLVINTMLQSLLGAAFDATGAGEEVAETMGREFGLADPKAPEDGGLVLPIKLSEEWYRTNMPPVKAAIEDGALALPRDDEWLADFRLVKVIRGVPKLPDLRTGEKGKKRHGDAVIATALALFALRMQHFAYGYQAVTGRSGREPGRAYDLPADEDERDGDFQMGSLKKREGLL